jgi:starch-binding outer membrane protein, SusD/RagB family
MTKMKRFNITALSSILLICVLLFSCEDFFDPEQDLYIKDNQMYDDWYEYRSVAMGMYALAQNLSEQIVILGDLRGDLLTVTPNASADLIDINNFNISRSNRYASPTNFFKLISASNNLIRVLQREQPQVLDPDSPVTNYDRLYGEALCMRAWAYFNAVKIYGRVPYIHESLVTLEEIEAFVNSPVAYIDTIYIEFGLDGFYNDTIYNKPIELERNLFDTDMLIDKLTRELEAKVKAVGVDHSIYNNDVSWEITTWNEFAMHALLGQMYLTRGDLSRARMYFEKIIFNRRDGVPRYQLDFSFAGSNWKNIFSGIDNREHIFILPFNKSNYQQNSFQSLFESNGPHRYQLKPTRIAIDFWETVWRNQTINRHPTNPSLTRMNSLGTPGDIHRGYGASFIYANNWSTLSPEAHRQMLTLRALGDEVSSRNIMVGLDTLVNKYSINKNVFDKDANFIVYRAADIHLYMAEILIYHQYMTQGGALGSDFRYALGYLNDGTFTAEQSTLSRTHLGVRGRAEIGLRLGTSSIAGTSAYDRIELDDIIYIHDPYTNEIAGWRNFTGNLPAKQRYFVDKVINERARELAFEGKRFYDLIRIARRRNDPDYLARAVSAKFPVHQREHIRTLLQDDRNWYINYFE